MSLVECYVSQYVKNCFQHNRILLFPPLSSRCRFLIHNWIEENNFDHELTTFSVGIEDQRRIVVCFKYLLKDESVEMFEKDKEQDVSSPGTSNKRFVGLSKDRKKRRPDKVLYIPRAKRQSDDEKIVTADDNSEKTNNQESKVELTNVVKMEPNVVEKVPTQEFPSEDVAWNENQKRQFENETAINQLECDKQFANDLKIDQEQLNVLQTSKIKNGMKLTPTENRDVVSDEYLSLKSSPLGEISDQHQKFNCSEGMNASENEKEISDKTLKCSDVFEPIPASAIETTKAFDNATSNEEAGASETKKNHKIVKLRRRSSIKEDSWDVKFDDNGDCLDSSVMEELTNKVGNVTVGVPEIDYYTLETKEPELNDETFGHILEIYNFPVEYKTQDLMTAFHSFKSRGFNIKWVDDTHALVIFGNRAVAEEAVHLNHPMVKARPMSQATLASKRKAKHSSEFLQPYKERPQTSTLMVNRLLSGALGMPLPISKQKRAEEGKKLKDAIERKRLALKQREDAWEGVLGNTE